jgi:hypothetical protein
MNGYRLDAAGRTACAVLLVVATTVAEAQARSPMVNAPNDVADLGFSYFLGLGGQTAQYREDSALVPVKSRATTTSPLIVTGALYAISHEVLFSLGSETTFAPGNTTEKWSATTSQFNGQTLTDPVVQRNGFSLTQNTTQLLGLYRIVGNWFAVAGPSLHTQTFKRYSFTQGVDRAVSLPNDHTVEESTSEILANLGVGLESGKVRGQSLHYGVRAMVGLPVWSRTDNSESPGVNFKSASGYDLSLEGRVSWAVVENIHVGVWGQWLASERRRAITGDFELPQNRLTSTSYGLELLWKL